MRVTTPSYEAFLAGAQFFGDRALRDYVHGDHRGILLDAGMLVEHTAKALLIREDPAYLVEMKSGGFENLLRLKGQSGQAADAVRTIGANEAILRVQRTAKIEPPKGLAEVLAVRNGIAHAAAFDETRTRQLLTAALLYCDEIYAVLGLPDPWAQHDELVGTLVEQQWDDVQHEVYRKTAAARARLSALMAEIPESEHAIIAAQKQNALTSLAYRTIRKPSGQLHVGVLVDCPVCGHEAALAAGPLHEEQAVVETGLLDLPEDLVTLALWIVPDDLQCRVCGVRFTGADEVKLAGVPERLDIDQKIRMFLGGQRTDFELPEDFYDEGPWSID